MGYKFDILVCNFARYHSRHANVRYPNDGILYLYLYVFICIQDLTIILWAWDEGDFLFRTDYLTS